MELEQHDERHGSERRQTGEPAAAAEQAVVNPPFASEGLEQVRDSHC
ncbi:hypothetical protein JQ612_07060 [Bradyrhizobium manausense]|nr:hypothetical protein [Bradyrhizobium manausense]MBR0689393.1 hypothetical protein [Bradyrhizobium manausense]MBR0721907.1 hypothetical protein [Bradyrhizobium manausense]MBR0832948.1 hypothetical protein [Bradyrhizobium manausense]